MQMDAPGGQIRGNYVSYSHLLVILWAISFSSYNNLPPPSPKKDAFYEMHESAILPRDSANALDGALFAIQIHNSSKPFYVDGDHGNFLNCSGRNESFETESAFTWQLKLACLRYSTLISKAF